MAIAKAQCHCEICGQDFEVRASKHNRRQADEFEEWARYNITICRECRFKEQKAKEHEQAVKTSNGLPELKGSEKQIAWAFDIRGKFATTKGLNEKAAKLFRETYLCGKTSAEWWIDHRYADSPLDLLRRIKLGGYGKAEMEELRKITMEYFPEIKKKE